MNTVALYQHTQYLKDVYTVLTNLNSEVKQQTSIKSFDFLDGLKLPGRHIKSVGLILLVRCKLGRIGQILWQEGTLQM
jgi:hypothetical protein